MKWARLQSFSRLVCLSFKKNNRWKTPTVEVPQQTQWYGNAVPPLLGKQMALQPV